MSYKNACGKFDIDLRDDGSPTWVEIGVADSLRVMEREDWQGGGWKIIHMHPEDLIDLRHLIDRALAA